jgi:hypothetical protein
MSEILYAAANYLPVWRDSAVALLALVVIGCLWLYVSLGEP